MSQDLYSRLIQDLAYRAHAADDDRYPMAAELAAALRAVVELHRPATLAEIDEHPDGPKSLHCNACYKDSWFNAPYPCETISVIASNLGIEVEP